MNYGYPKMNISKNEYRTSINKLRRSINTFKDIIKYIFGYPKFMLNLWGAVLLFIPYLWIS